MSKHNSLTHIQTQGVTAVDKRGRAIRIKSNISFINVCTIMYLHAHVLCTVHIHVYISLLVNSLSKEDQGFQLRREAFQQQLKEPIDPLPHKPHIYRLLELSFAHQTKHIPYPIWLLDNIFFPFFRRNRRYLIRGIYIRRK